MRNEENELKQVRRYYGWSDIPDVKECAENAYTDSVRPLHGIGLIGSRKSAENSAKAERLEKWRQKVNKHIVLRVENFSQIKEEFDVWHGNTCDKIVTISKDILGYIEEKNEDLFKNKFHSTFPYGVAQKWLNMTIKNMLILEMLGDKNISNHIRQFDRGSLHVPVDSIIIKCAIDMNNKLNEEVIVIPKLPWSQFNKCQYTAFQDGLNTAIRLVQKEATLSTNWNTRVDWEFDVWPKKRDSDERDIFI